MNDYSNIESTTIIHTEIKLLEKKIDFLFKQLNLIIKILKELQHGN